MDDIIEFLVELVLDILFEGGMELSADKKLPKWVRIVAGIVLLIVFSGIVGIFLYIAYEALQEGDTVASVVSFCIAVGLVIFFVWGFISKYHEVNKNKKK